MGANAGANPNRFGALCALLGAGLRAFCVRGMGGYFLAVGGGEKRRDRGGGGGVETPKRIKFQKNRIPAV